MFIELDGYYYKNGTYLTKPIAINVRDIMSVTEVNDYYFDCTRVITSNKFHYDVKQTYTEIMERIQKAYEVGYEHGKSY